jgi:gliding motility-associated-like protein
MNKNTLKLTNLIGIVVLLLLTLNVQAQWLQVGEKIVNTIPAPARGFGLSIALSPDGSRIAGASTNSNYGGWVYSIDGSNFVKIGDIVINETPKTINVTYPWLSSNGIGQSVSIASDNKTIVIGYPIVDPENRKGATSVFSFNGSGFTEVGTKLQGIDSPGGLISTIAGQGKSVSISGDGKFLIIGASGSSDSSPLPDAPNSGNVGAAWIYTFNGTNYDQLRPQLIGTGAGGAWGLSTQGYSVDISKEGKIAIVSGVSDASFGIGAIWVYSFNGVNFLQLGSKITGSNQIGVANFGLSISISSDGKTFVVGGPDDNYGIGAVWVYKYNGTSFVQVGTKLIPNDYVSAPPITPKDIRHGVSVSISGDGNTIIVGGTGDNANNGAAWIYTFNGTNFTQAGKKLVPSGSAGATPNIGNSVSISENGRRVAIAGYYDNNKIGAAWVYELCSAPVIASTCIDYNKVLHVVASSTFPMSYQWNKDAALLGVTTVPSFDITASIDGNGDSKYSVVVVNSCTVTSAFSGEITQNDLIARKILGDLIVCKGDSARLLTNNLQSIQWSNNSTGFSLSFLPIQNTIISFTGINNQNCPVKDVATITIAGITDIKLDLSSINNSCDTLKTVTLTGGFPANGTYKYNGTPKSILNISSEGDYIITYSYTNENNCTNSIMDTLKIIHCLEPPICERVDAPCTCPGRKCPPVFAIYHSFTPNGDGINDTWVIDTLSSTNTLTIVDKWGNEVFKADPYKNDWSGNNQDGKKLPDGVYYYFLTITNTKERFTGAISIIH